jgi:O-antigen/teichoic acid export membrane protein
LALLLITAAALGYGDRATLVGLAVLIMVCQAINTPLFATFNAHRVLLYPAILTMAAAVVSTTLGLGLVAAGLGPAGLLIGMLAAQVFAVIGGYSVLARRLGRRPRPVWQRAEVVRFVRTALPIAATNGLAIIYQRLDILMLSQLATVKAVAVYSVAYSLVQYTWVLPQVVGAAYFPVLNQELRVDREQARRSYFLIVRLFFVVSLPVTLLLAVAAEPLMVTVFGPNYAESGHVLTIMAWISVLGFQNYVLWYGFLVAHREGLVVRIMLVGLLANAALNAALIPVWGAAGSAVALLVSDLIVVVWQVVLFHRHVFRIPWRQVLTGPIAAGALAALTVLLLLPISRVGAGLGGGAIYALALIGSGYVTWDEWAPLRAPVVRVAARVARAMPGRTTR